MDNDKLDGLRRSAESRVAYLLRLADALANRDSIICQMAAHELRTLAEGVRVNTSSQPADEGR